MEVSFRDHYLINSERGQVYISDYEYFSNKIEIVDNISVNDIVTIVTEINNYVVPVILRLKQNPNSTDILYDELTKNHVIGVLNIAKNYFTDDISVEKINSYILFVNQNVNQPIASVHALFI
jgi:DNA-binding protein